MTYPTEAAAIRRVFFLAALGIWPGYVRVPGGWQLTYDPPVHSRTDHEGGVLL